MPHTLAADYLKPGFIFNIRAKGDKDWTLDIWCRNISQYFRAKITFPLDRLIAVSALAKLFADELHSTYLAGLWLEGLWYTLSWYRRKRDCAERPKDYIAPSWSWASTNAEVDWHEQRSRFIEKRVEILDAVVEYVGDPFGQVSHGWICVRGPLVENVSLSDTGQIAFLDFMYPDYLGESPPAEVHCLLLFTSRLYTDKKFFFSLSSV